MPNPEKSDVRNRARTHGYAASGDGINVCEPSAMSWTSTPPIDGSRTRSAPTPRLTINGNAPAPRATGGQTTPATAIAIGTSIVRPTTTSSGPPGR